MGAQSTQFLDTDIQFVGNSFAGSAKRIGNVHTATARTVQFKTRHDSIRLPGIASSRMAIEQVVLPERLLDTQESAQFLDLKPQASTTRNISNPFGESSAAKMAADLEA